MAISETLCSQFSDTVFYQIIVTTYGLCRDHSPALGENKKRHFPKVNGY